MTSYIPAKGDLILATFDPQSRSRAEGQASSSRDQQRSFQSAHRPDDRLPDHEYEEKPSFPPPESTVTGFVMVEQVKAMDFRARQVRFLEKAPEAVLNEALSLLDTCLY